MADPIKYDFVCPSVVSNLDSFLLNRLIVKDRVYPPRKRETLA